MGKMKEAFVGAPVDDPTPVTARLLPEEKGKIAKQAPDAAAAEPKEREHDSGNRKKTDDGGDDHDKHRSSRRNRLSNTTCPTLVLFKSGEYFSRSW